VITFKQWYKAMTTRGSGMAGTERSKMKCSWNAAIYQAADRRAELRAEIAAKDAEIERLRAENADKVETIQRESELRGAQHGAGQARREVVNYLRSIGQHLAAQGVIERCKWPNGTQINNNEEIK